MVLIKRLGNVHDNYNGVFRIGVKGLNHLVHCTLPYQRLSVIGQAGLFIATNASVKIIVCPE
jgi:hypothetical protein